jgi:hypothetical protein
MISSSPLGGGREADGKGGVLTGNGAAKCDGAAQDGEMQGSSESGGHNA